MEFSFVSDPLKESYVLRLITERLQINHDVAFYQFYYCLSVSGDRPNAKVEMLFSMSWLIYLSPLSLMAVAYHKPCWPAYHCMFYLKYWHSVIADLAYVIIRP